MRLAEKEKADTVDDITVSTAVLINIDNAPSCDTTLAPSLELLTGTSVLTPHQVHTESTTSHQPETSSQYSSQELF